MKRTRDCVFLPFTNFIAETAWWIFMKFDAGEAVNVAEWIYLCLWYENTKIISRQKKPVRQIVVYKSLSLSSFCFCPSLGLSRHCALTDFSYVPLGVGGVKFTFKWWTLRGVRRQLLLNKYRSQGRVVRDSVVWYLWRYLCICCKWPSRSVMYEK